MIPRKSIHLLLVLLTLLTLFTACDWSVADDRVASANATESPATRPYVVTDVPRDLHGIRALEARIQDVLKKVAPATVSMSGGSGVVISRDGYILTVGHLVRKPGRPVTILFPDGRRVKGKTLGANRGVDSGLVKITDEGEWPHVEMGRSADVKAGQWCVALGYPVLFARGKAPMARIGRVLRVTDRVLLADSLIMGGDSGGPLFDLEGRVIAIGSRVGGSIYDNISVPVDVYRDQWDRLVAGEFWNDRQRRKPGDGQPKSQTPKSPEPKEPKATPEAGATKKPDAAKSEGQPKPKPSGEAKGESKDIPQKGARSGHRHHGGAAYARQFGHNTGPLKAAFVEAISAAAASTVRILSDGQPIALGTIVGADGRVLTKASVLKGKLTCHMPDGKNVPASLIATDKEFDVALLKVDAAQLTPPHWRAGGPPAPGSLVVAAGVHGKPMTIGLIGIEPRHFAIPRQRRGAKPGRGYLGVRIEAAAGGGAHVVEVIPKTAAHQAGLKIGDVIQKAGGQAIGTTDQLIQLLGKRKPGDKFELTVQRGEQNLTLSAKLGPVPRQFRNRPPQDRWGGGPFSERRFGFPSVLAHDMAINPRDCGGPLVDSTGTVVGINIARALRVASFAIAADDVQRLIKELSARANENKPAAEAGDKPGTSGANPDKKETRVTKETPDAAVKSEGGKTP